MSSFDLFTLPSEIPEGWLSGKVAVAVDILRAGTTIATALNSGAHCIHVCLDVEVARSRAAEYSEALLGGERGGVRIDGFDLSNSPSDYPSQVVRGRPIVFTTTNGTLAIHAGRQAEATVIGSFSNLAAVARFLADTRRPIVVICAGTNGQPTMEDVLFGGALCHHLRGSGWFEEHGKLKMNTAARFAEQSWRQAQQQMESGKSLFSVLRETQGGKNLVQLGLEEDIEFAAVFDRFSVVPKYDPVTGTIGPVVDLPEGAR